MWKSYVKRPVVINAVQITEEMFYDPCVERIAGVVYGVDCVTIETLEGTMTGNIGDWIIKGINGELYPCKPDIFEYTHERT